MFNGLKRIVGSSKCWLCLGGCVVAGATGNWVAIPKLIMLTIGSIAAEDAARKIGITTDIKEIKKALKR